MQLNTKIWNMPNADFGKFIVLEGIDGAGKTSVLQEIKKFLNKKDIHVVATREPGGTKLGEKLRVHLLYSDLEIMPEAELFLMLAARIQHLEEVVYPALKQGSWVVSDRFTDSTYAYQGGGGELSLDVIRTLEQLVQGNFRPNLVFILDVPVKEGLLRATKNDNFHNRLYEFYERTRQVYLKRAQVLTTHTLIDASKSKKYVEKQILKKLEDFVRISDGKN